MRCSHCGGDTTGAGDRCTACGAALPGSVAAGVLTPVPADWGATRLPETDATVVVPPSQTGGTPPAATTGVVAPGTVFGTRYHIIRPLGEGGMGRVYHAWDAELGVAVALKVIRREIAEDPYAAAEIERRFKRELLLARQVSHKNVVRIHDLGDINGTKYITMTYVEGSDLSAILAREGKIPVPRVVHFARQIAAGLQAAHEVGIVHRDLKPGNVMVGADDHAQIMDFGIARSATGDSGVGTVAGTIVGTMEYMAPEQAQGKTADQRADIYAFGLILYDLLLGRRPAPAGENAVAALMARMNQAPPSPRSIDPSIPEGLDAIIVKCVQPDREARYQTSAELVAALDRIDDAGLPLPERQPVRIPKLWLAAAVLTFGGIVGGATWWAASPPPPPVEREPVSVLIADFENRANDPVFDGTLENALTVAMEGASFINSFSRSTAQSLNAQTRPGLPLDEEGAQLISQREGIKVILAGSVLLDGTGYRVRVRAIDAIPGTVLAEAEARAASKADVLTAVGNVAAKMREALGDTAIESGRLAERETFTAASLEAASEYARAQTLANANKDEEAVALYRRATEQDPNFGRAYSGWAVSASKLGRTDEAAGLWKKALSLLDRMTERERLRTLGNYYASVSGSWEQAREAYEALVQRYPGDTAAQNNLATAQFNLRNFAKAREASERLVRLAPTSVLYLYNSALYAMYAGDFAAADDLATKALALNPETPKAYLARAVAAAASGDLAAARAHYAEGTARAGTRGASTAAIGLADLALYEGRSTEAVTILTPAVQADLDAKSTLGAVTKLAALAEAHQAAGNGRAAIKAATDALAARRTPATMVPAARVLVENGRSREALALAAELAGSLQPQSRAYGKVVEGIAALDARRTVEAVEALRAAITLADLWLARYWLGVAYVEAGAHAEALAELDACEKRRGEAAAIFLDDIPTWRYTAPVKYWLARAQEGIGVRDQADATYKAFLSIRGGSSDPLATDARRRLARTGT